MSVRAVFGRLEVGISFALSTGKEEITVFENTNGNITRKTFTGED
jgi:hypothetical protein